MQRVEHLRTCHAKSPMNAKALFVLPEWPYVKSIRDVLQLLRHIPIVRLLLGKEKYLSQISLPIIYWVIDTDNYVKMSSTPV